MRIMFKFRSGILIFYFNEIISGFQRKIIRSEMKMIWVWENYKLKYNHNITNEILDKSKSIDDFLVKMFFAELNQLKIKSVFEKRFRDQ